jgi:hypothetical protein
VWYFGTQSSSFDIWHTQSNITKHSAAEYNVHQPLEHRMLHSFPRTHNIFQEFWLKTKSNFLTLIVQRY